MYDGQFSGEQVGVVEEEGRVSLNDLPDDTLILIFNRLIDLKCLCLCSLVSPRFSSLVFQVHSVYFAAVGYPTNDLIPTPATDSLLKKTLIFFFNGIVVKPLQYFLQFLAPKPLPSMVVSIYFLSKIKSLRSLHVVFPSSTHLQNPYNDDSLYKWSAKLGPTLDTLVFLSTSSIRDGVEIDFDEQEQEDPAGFIEFMKRRVHLASYCLQEAIVWHRVLRVFIEANPLLDNITITDSHNLGSLSLKDSKVVEMRNWLNSSSQAELNKVEFPVIIQHMHMPMLKLPLSNKVMVRPTLVLLEMADRRNEHRDWGGDAAEIATRFSEQGDDEFAQAIVEMMVNHNSKMGILSLV